MIKYKVTKCDDEYKIEVKGHANQNPYGSDIVCASVSTALIMTYNLLERLNLFRCNITAPVCEEGLFSLNMKLSDNTLKEVLNNLSDSLDMLASAYPKYIKSEK